MKTNISLLKVDLTIQKILGVIYLLCGLFGMAIHFLLFIAMIVQFIIGVWQVLSAIIFAITARNKERVYYLLCVITLFAAIASFIYLIEERILNESIPLGILGLIVIPVILGIWYLNISQRHHDAIVNASPSEDNLNTLDMENILDSDELLKKP